MKTIALLTRPFAALRTDGSVVAWGWPEFGGDRDSVPE